MIRFSVLGVFCLLALASSAHADGPFGGSLKDEVVPVFRWTGFYVGINGGYGWAANPGDIHYESSLGLADRSGGPDAAGGFGGGQIGYNWQGPFSPNVVVGVEADIQAADVQDTFHGTTDNGLVGFARQDLEWFGTVRGRLGWAFDHTLVYGTGGFAYGRVEDSTFGTALGQSISMRSDDNRTGYVVGGGIEYAFGGNLSLKVEYQFINLGDESLFGVFTPSGVTATSSPIDASFHTVRAGLNLKLY